MAFDLKTPNILILFMKKKVLLGALYSMWVIMFLLSLGVVSQIETVQSNEQYQWHGNEHSQYLKTEWNTNIGYRLATYFMWSSAGAGFIYVIFKSYFGKSTK